MVVSTSTLRFQSAHCPVGLWGWVSHWETALGHGEGSPALPAAAQAPSWRGHLPLPCLKRCSKSQGRCPSPSWVPRWEGSGGNTGVWSGNSCCTRVRWALFDAQNVWGGTLLTFCRWGKMKHQIPIWSSYVYFGDVKCKWIACKTWARVRRKSCSLSPTWQITGAAGAVTAYRVARNNQWNYSLRLRGCLSAITEIRHHQNCWKNPRITYAQFWDMTFNRAILTGSFKKKTTHKLPQ